MELLNGVVEKTTDMLTWSKHVTPETLIGTDTQQTRKRADNLRGRIGRQTDSQINA